MIELVVINIIKVLIFIMVFGIVLLLSFSFMDHVKKKVEQQEELKRKLKNLDYWIK